MYMNYKPVDLGERLRLSLGYLHLKKYRLPWLPWLPLHQFNFLRKSPKQPVQDVWTSCETPSQSLMLLSRYSQPFPSWLPFGNGGIWQVESHLFVKQIYYYLTRKCKQIYYYLTRKCKTLPPTIWKWDHHKLWGRPFPGIFLEITVFSQIFKL